MAERYKLLHKKDGVPETRVIFVMENETPYTAKKMLEKKKRMNNHTLL